MGLIMKVGVRSVFGLNLIAPACKIIHLLRKATFLFRKCPLSIHCKSEAPNTFCTGTRISSSKSSFQLSKYLLKKFNSIYIAYIQHV